ncbi:MAG TPA: phosphotransferase [Opitutus sp.]|nr:phosphotransferase [Opitutus sp.]
MSASIFNRVGPSDGSIVRTLKDGYWDRTEIVAMPDGSQRVRKRSKGAKAPGPWSVRSLRREIVYLTGLSSEARSVFPEVLHAWDVETGDVPDVGYEMPFFSEHQDAGIHARAATIGQSEIDLFQDHLADAMIGRLHVAEKPEEPLSEHVVAAVVQALADLRRDPVLAPLVEAERIELNGVTCWGPAAAFDRIQQTTDAFGALDAAPSVRLHGDFFLENILWRHAPAEGHQPRLVLIDPVSVAGVSSGPPVFDLVKYESYAKGELLALRSAWVDVAGFEPRPTGKYGYRILWNEPGLKTFRSRNWHARFRSAYEKKFGAVDMRMYRLIDGYFSAAMAVNTAGAQRRGRLLKATVEFNAVLNGGLGMNCDEI